MSESADEAAVTYYPFEPNWTIPPGAMLKEWAEENGVGKEALAETLLMTESRLDDLIAGKIELTPEIALILLRVTDIPTRIWLRWEANYRADLARGAKQIAD